jgi:hypothetical protein
MTSGEVEESVNKESKRDEMWAKNKVLLAE